MRPALPEDAYQAILTFIADSTAVDGGAVVGLSGGIDSALVARLCVDALGPEKVLTIFMPSSTTPEPDLELTDRYAASLGIDHMVVPIQGMMDDFVASLPDAGAVARGNIGARCRMIVLYHLAREMGRMVIGTGNKSELLQGYFTKHGDGGVDLLPIGDLYKSQVLELSRQIGLPKEVVDRAPSAGLWEGQTDEEDMGMGYEELDLILNGIEMQMPMEEIVARTGTSEENARRVWDRYQASAHKRRVPLIPKLSFRTIGSDWRE